MIKLNKKMIVRWLLLARCQCPADGSVTAAISEKLKAAKGGNAGPHYVSDGRWAISLGLIDVTQRAIIETGTAGISAALGLWDKAAGPQPETGRMADKPYVDYMEAGLVVRLAEEQAKRAAASLCGEKGKEFKRTKWIYDLGGGVEGLEYQADTIEGQPEGEKLYLDRRIVEGLTPFIFQTVFAVDSKSPCFACSMPSISEPWNFGIMIMPLRIKR